MPVNIAGYKSKTGIGRGLRRGRGDVRSGVATKQRGRAKGRGASRRGGGRKMMRRGGGRPTRRGGARGRPGRGKRGKRGRGSKQASKTNNKKETTREKKEKKEKNSRSPKKPKNKQLRKIYEWLETIDKSPLGKEDLKRIDNYFDRMTGKSPTTPKVKEDQAKPAASSDPEQIAEILRKELAAHEERKQKEEGDHAIHASSKTTLSPILSSTKMPEHSEIETVTSQSKDTVDIGVGDSSIRRKTGKTKSKTASRAKAVADASTTNVVDASTDDEPRADKTRADETTTVASNVLSEDSSRSKRKITVDQELRDLIIRGLSQDTHTTDSFSVEDRPKVKFARDLAKSIRSMKNYCSKYSYAIAFLINAEKHRTSLQREAMMQILHILGDITNNSQKEILQLQKFLFD